MELELLRSGVSFVWVFDYMPAKIYKNLAHPAFVADPQACIVVGDRNDIAAAYVRTQPVDPFTHATRSGTARIVISNSPIEVADEDAENWNYLIKAQLADLVDKNMIIFEMPVGSALTSTAIRSL